VVSYSGSWSFQDSVPKLELGNQRKFDLTESLENGTRCVPYRALLRCRRAAIPGATYFILVGLILTPARLVSFKIPLSIFGLLRLVSERAHERFK
jgi:hypothetical protein